MEQHEDRQVQNTKRPKRGPCLLKKEKRGRRSAPYRPDPKASTAYYVAMVA